MGRTVYLNGHYVDEAEATVSIFDRGFLFADAVYEVTSVIDGRLIDNDAHMARLQRSLSELDMPAADIAAIETAQRTLMERNGLREGVIYLQISRGAAERDFLIAADMSPTIIMFTQEKALVDNPAARNGIRIVTREDMRWKRRDIKTVQLLASSLAKTSASGEGADDVWMVEDGVVTEGSSNNAYIVKDQTIITRHLGNEILHGITRASVLKVAEREGLAIEERPFTVAEAKAADEAFITSASSLVTGIVAIDGETIGNGKPGAVTRHLRSLYIEHALH